MRFGKNNHVLSPLAILLIGGSLFTALLLTTTIPAQANPATPDTRHVTILHTNDIHGHLQAWQGWEGDFADRTVGGLDRLAARVTEIRAEVGKQRVLLLDAGDTIGDTMIAAKTEGRAVIETMNSIGYDAMAVGNHEPDFSAEKLKARIAQARFAVLGANIVEQSTGDLFTEPYILCEVDGLKVGILGIAYPNTPLTTAHKNVDNLRFLSLIHISEPTRPY